VALGNTFPQFRRFPGILRNLVIFRKRLLSQMVLIETRRVIMERSSMRDGEPAQLVGACIIDDIVLAFGRCGDAALS
jgi:hypothetical protein